MAKYSPQFQENTVRQLVPPLLRNVAQVSRETGMSEPTLYAWKKRTQSQGTVLPSRATQPEGRDAKTKLAAIIETAAMNEAERSAYCREHGLYSERLDAWRVAFENMGMSGSCRTANWRRWPPYASTLNKSTRRSPMPANTSPDGP